MLLLTALACVPPYLHYWLIHDNLDGFRYPWGPGFLPAEFLFLRHFGELSAWVPAWLFVAFIGSFSRPPTNRKVAVAASSVFILFLVAYLSYALLIVHVLIKRENDSKRAAAASELRR